MLDEDSVKMLRDMLVERAKMSNNERQALIYTGAITVLEVVLTDLEDLHPMLTELIQ
jgi:hypothetical protein